MPMRYRPGVRLYAMVGGNNCNALKEMESNEESTVGADHLHILLAD